MITLLIPKFCVIKFLQFDVTTSPIMTNIDVKCDGRNFLITAGKGKYIILGSISAVAVVSLLFNLFVCLKRRKTTAIPTGNLIKLSHQPVKYQTSQYLTSKCFHMCAGRQVNFDTRKQNTIVGQLNQRLQ